MNNFVRELCILFCSLINFEICMCGVLLSVAYHTVRLLLDEIFVSSFVCSLVHWFVGSLVRWFVGSLVRSFVHSFIHQTQLHFHCVDQE